MQHLIELVQIMMSATNRFAVTGRLAAQVPDLCRARTQNRASLIDRLQPGVKRHNVGRPHRTCSNTQAYCAERCIERSGRRSRSEEHTSELQSLMRISYAVFCLKKKKKTTNYTK